MAAGVREVSMNKKKNSMISTIILVIILLVGFSVMLYPTVSNWWNEHLQAKAISEYERSVSDLSDKKCDAMIEKADEYNKKLFKLSYPFAEYEKLADYNKILDITGTGIMGYVSIPKINVELPVYHGTSSEVLNSAVGHMQGSSFPVGGENTHAVISAHRGLPSAKLFSDLNKLEIGDTFSITVLNKIFTYEVDNIIVVKPDEMDKLKIQKGCDNVTLMTCTPYGVNSHRLLVRGHRVSAKYPHNVNITSDAVQIDPMEIIPFVMVPILFCLILYWIFGDKNMLSDKRRIESYLKKSKYIGEDKNDKNK